MTARIINDHNYIFEIVDKIPKGFFVWNIGDNAPKGYIPLCEWLYPDDESSYSINPNTLKVLYVDNATRTLLLNAAGYGISCKEDAEKELEKDNETDSTYASTVFTAKKRRYYAETCLPIFERISE